MDYVGALAITALGGGLFWATLRSTLPSSRLGTLKCWTIVHINVVVSAAPSPATPGHELICTADDQRGAVGLDQGAAVCRRPCPCGAAGPDAGRPRPGLRRAHGRDDPVVGGRHRGAQPDPRAIGLRQE